MAVNSLENLLSTKKELREQIDLLIVCTQTPDFQLPQVSSQIQSRCNLPKKIASFDISLGCSGFVYGLSLVESMMMMHNYSNAVLITVDAYSTIIDVKDRTVIVVEDIVDTGNTLHHYLKDLKSRGAKEIKIASLLNKPEALQHSITIDYLGFKIDNKFVIGYGLDYDYKGRNFKGIYQLK